MSKPRILFFNPVQHALEAYKALSSVAQTEVVSSKTRQEFFEDIGNKYADIQVIYRTSASGAVAGRFDEELVRKLPSTLKAICHNGAGYDQIDVQACSDRGIFVTYAPDPVTIATADLTMFLILGTIRQLNPSLVSLRQGNFKKNLAFGHELTGKTLGILGMGRIGRAVMKRAEPFGMKIIYHNRTRSLHADVQKAKYVSFDQLITDSDILSIHAPLQENTHHLIGVEQLDNMKDGAIIINTARGAIIDEAALAIALDDGKLAAVGLDVYEKEPLVHPLLLKNERALLVPHLGTHTFETLREMETLAMENAKRAVTNQPLLTIVPEQLTMKNGT